jgi:hypothetical protein
MQPSYLLHFARLGSHRDSNVHSVIRVEVFCDCRWGSRKTQEGIEEPHCGDLEKALRTVKFVGLDLMDRLGALEA